MFRSLAVALLLVFAASGGFVDHVTAETGVRIDAARTGASFDVVETGTGPDVAETEASIADSGERGGSNDSTPSIVEVYPNPAASDDAGEFVTIQFPPGTNVSAYALADNHRTVSLSANGDGIPHEGRVTFSTHPNQTRSLTDRFVRPLSDRLQLANGGDSIRLLRNGTVVDEVRYRRAPETERYNVTRGSWQPLGATDRPVVTAGGGTVEAFVLPDAPDRVLELLESADRRILLAGYTFASPRVADALTDAVARGLTVEVLVDDAPAGGMTDEQVSRLDELAAAGVTVRAFGGERARYRYHHAKYAVADDTALVTTENWKPSGLGGQSSRGWGVITDQPPIVSGLVETYRADTGWVDTIPWTEFEPSPVEDDPVSGDYPTAFPAKEVTVERTELLVTPDNAAERIRERIASAEESIDILQMQIGDVGFPLLQEVLAAAERGVEVRILLSSAWYVEEENSQLKVWLEEQAAAEDLHLQVQLADPEGYEKIHAKGVIIDGETVIVGSINWNNNSVQNNREVVLVLDGKEAAGYFQQVFEADWEASEKRREFPAGLVAAVAVGALAAIVGARRIDFE